MVRLYRVVLPVSDIDEASAFYGKALNLKGERISKGRHYFNCGGTALVCYDPLAEGDKLGQGWMHLKKQYFYFSVPNLEGAYVRVKNAGASNIDEEISESPSGERLFHAADPFGNPIAFVDEKTVPTWKEKS